MKNFVHQDDVEIWATFWKIWKIFFENFYEIQVKSLQQFWNNSEIILERLWWNIRDLLKKLIDIFLNFAELLSFKKNLRYFEKLLNLWNFEEIWKHFWKIGTYFLRVFIKFHTNHWRYFKKFYNILEFMRRNLGKFLKILVETFWKFL